MSSETSTIKKEKARIFDMILNSPGMADECKLNLKITRKNALLLGRLIESGLLTAKKEMEDDFLVSLNEMTQADFKLIHEEILKRAGLTEFYKNLKEI
jgi:hypothetical protein